MNDKMINNKTKGGNLSPITDLIEDAAKDIHRGTYSLHGIEARLCELSLAILDDVKKTLIKN
jgi:hypothetical protein